MFESEEYEQDNRGEGEVLSTYVGEDDGCNYLPSLIWQMRSRADLRKPFQPKPKPVYAGTATEALQSNPKKYHIGKRRSYSRSVFIGIYQLNRRGMNEKIMAENLGIPVEDLRDIMKHRSNVQAQCWRYIQQQPMDAIPGIPEIMRRLQKEDRHALANSKVL